jgi:hypothetical protein
MRTTIISIIGLFFTSLTYGQVSDSTENDDDPIECIKKESVGGKLDFNLTLERRKRDSMYMMELHIIKRISQFFFGDKQSRE